MGLSNQMRRPFSFSVRGKSDNQSIELCEQNIESLIEPRGLENSCDVIFANNFAAFNILIDAFR